MFHSSGPRSTAGGIRGLVPRLYGRLRPLRPGEPVHVPLGTFCHIATALRDCGLRRWTGPFDWIFSTPALIADCLEDGFAEFLNPIHLRSVPARELTHGATRQCRHLLYEARYGLPTLFNHHDPAASGTDLRSLRRAVARLEAALAGDGPAILYLMSEVAWPRPEIDRLAGTLARVRAPAVLACVTATAGGDERAWSVEERRVDSCPVLEVALTTASRSGGTRFLDPDDNTRFAMVLADLAERGERASKGHI